MKFTVEGAEFKKHLQEVCKIINAKNPLQILGNVLFEIEAGKLALTGSDSDNSLRVEMPIVECEGDGTVCLEAKTLLEIVKEVSSQPMTFTVDENNYSVELRYHNGEFQFMGINGIEYPRPKELETNDDTYHITMPANVVRKGIERTVYACSADMLRPAMTGIFWDIHPEDITFVGSDTHKLVRYINSEVKPGIETSFILAAKPAGVLAAMVSSEDADIDITVTGRHATFRAAGKCLTCQFVNGTYPNYNRVIPQSSPYALTVDRAALLSALRRVAIFTSKASGMIRFDIEPTQIRLSGNDLDFATHSEERVLCDYNGDKMTIGFNAEYTIDILQYLTGETTVIELSDPARPGVFRPFEKEEGEDLVTIQMPIQTM